MGREPRHRLTIEVDPPYPVAIGPGILDELPELLPTGRLAVISDTTVLASQGAALEAALAGREHRVFAVPPGEGSKTIARWAELQRALAQDGFDRGSCVVAFGGGVVGDLAGFVAASYLRGVALVQLPTSLLAMVDASVGGKTGVNLPEGKNLVGAFWQPAAVIADTTLLATLPVRVFREGAVEAFKAGLLADPALCDAVVSPAVAPDGDPAAVADLVARSVRIKARIVAADEREAGQRAHLNLGHTLAHALEAVSDHALPHGEAVAYGLLYAAILAARRGWSDQRERALALIAWLRPGPLPEVGIDALEPFFARDKKTTAQRVRFVLLREPGRPTLVGDVDPAERGAAWSELYEVVRGLPLRSASEER